MDFDKTRIEQIGNSAVRTRLARVDGIRFEVFENDKTTAIDGYIEVYPLGVPVKKPYRGRISIQVKSSVAKDASTFQHEKADVECYLGEGGVLFFRCSVTEDYRDEGVYYDCLLPIDLRGMLHTMGDKGTQSISRPLKPLPEDPVELRRVIDEFLAHKLQQARFILKEPGDLVALTEAGLGITSLSMPKVPRSGAAGLTLEDFSNGGYLYATMEDGSEAAAAFNSLSSFSVSRAERVFSGEFSAVLPTSIVERPEGTTLNLGTISITSSSVGHASPMRVRFTYEGAFHERALTGRLMLTLLETGEVMFGKRVLTLGRLEIEPKEKERLEQITCHTERISRTLDALHVKLDWDPAALSPKELADLDAMEIAILGGKAIPIPAATDCEREAGLVDVNVAGSTIRLFACKESYNLYRVYDPFSAAFPFVFGFSTSESGEGFVEIPPLLSFSVEDYTRLVNLDVESFDERLAGIKRGEGFDAAVNPGILNMLMAFDAGAKAPDELLLIATHAAKAAFDFNDNPINQLNYWQAVARKRALSEGEKDMLAELEEDCHDNHAISVACSSLIGDERRARIAMRQMSPEQRSEFNSQPIARFLGNQGSDS